MCVSVYLIFFSLKFAISFNQLLLYKDVTFLLILDQRARRGARRATQPKSPQETWGHVVPQSLILNKFSSVCLYVTFSVEIAIFAKSTFTI